MALTASINNVKSNLDPRTEGDEISAVLLNINGDTWGKEVWLGASNFPMIVLGSDNKGGTILQHKEKEDLYYVQSIDLTYHMI